MGLDNFWKQHPEDDKVMECDIELHLCGGMFSGDGNGSFRGKVYNNYILSVTGESLYQDVIPPETIKIMAEKLEEDTKNITKEKLEQEAGAQFDFWTTSSREKIDLAKMFRYYADRDAYLIGWW